MSWNRALKSSKKNAFNKTTLLRSYQESKHIFEAGLRLGWVVPCRLKPLCVWKPDERLLLVFKVALRFRIPGKK